MYYRVSSCPPITTTKRTKRAIHFLSSVAKPLTTPLVTWPAPPQPASPYLLSSLPLPCITIDIALSIRRPAHPPRCVSSCCPIPTAALRRRLITPHPPKASIMHGHDQGVHIPLNLKSCASQVHSHLQGNLCGFDACPLPCSLSIKRPIAILGAACRHLPSHPSLARALSCPPPPNVLFISLLKLFRSLCLVTPP